jgi:hypothetical protein
MNILLRIVLTLVLAFGLIGFGTCSLMGIGLSVQDPEPMLLVLLVLGLLITAACAVAIFRIWFRKKP